MLLTMFKSYIITLFLIFTPLLCVQTCTLNITHHITLEDEQEVFANNVGKLLWYIKSQGYYVTFGEAYRTHEQALIYAHEGLGIKDSLHCERLAIDLNIFDKNEKMLTTVKETEKFGSYWETLHPFNVWGGRWTHRPDFDHFQMNPEH